MLPAWVVTCSQGTESRVKGWTRCRTGVALSTENLLGGHYQCSEPIPCRAAAVCAELALHARMHRCMCPAVLRCHGAHRPESVQRRMRRRLRPWRPRRPGERRRCPRRWSSAALASWARRWPTCWIRPPSAPRAGPEAPSGSEFRGYHGSWWHARPCGPLDRGGSGKASSKGSVSGK